MAAALLHREKLVSGIVMARDTSRHGVPRVALPMWGHRPHHGIPLVWGSGSPWAVPSSCSPFLAGAGFNGGGEWSITAPWCPPSVPKDGCPQGTLSWADLGPPLAIMGHQLQVMPHSW